MSPKGLGEGCSGLRPEQDVPQMAAAADTLQIEAFQTNLHGARILCQGPFPEGKQPPILDAITDRKQPFQKKVLLTHTPFSFSKALPLPYDATFHITSATDWSLALTYIVHAPKPLLVVADDLPSIPDGVWPRVTRGITFVQHTSVPQRQFRPYDAVFFAAIDDATTPYAEFTYRGLQTLLGAVGPKEFREIVSELRVAAAGIAWSKVDEANEKGALYWYEPVRHHTVESLSKKQLADLFTFLAGQFAGT
jgi:hypothetical protein